MRKCEPKGSLGNTQIETHLEGLPEFVAHNTVQYWVDTRRYKVENSGGVVQYLISYLYCLMMILIIAVYCKQSLSVEGGPAKEKRDDNSN